MWMDPCGTGDFEIVTDTSVIVGKASIEISQDPSRLFPLRCLRVATLRRVQWTSVVAIERRTYAKYSANMHPIGNVLLLWLLGETDDGQCIVYLL